MLVADQRIDHRAGHPVTGRASAIRVPVASIQPRDAAISAIGSRVDDASNAMKVPGKPAPIASEPQIASAAARFRAERTVVRDRRDERFRFGRMQVSSATTSATVVSPVMAPSPEGDVAVGEAEPAATSQDEQPRAEHDSPLSGGSRIGASTASARANNRTC